MKNETKLHPAVESGIWLTGIKLIMRERERQITQEGWMPNHDDRHGNQELLRAAECYERHAESPRRKIYGPPQGWPWESKWWKPTYAERDLTKAGALYLAEHDRQKRVDAPSEILNTLKNSMLRCARRIEELRVVKG